VSNPVFGDADMEVELKKKIFTFILLLNKKVGNNGDGGDSNAAFEDNLAAKMKSNA